MLYYAPFCRSLPTVAKDMFPGSLCHGTPEYGKIWQIDTVNRSKNVIESQGITTNCFS